MYLPFLATPPCKEDAPDLVVVMTVVDFDGTTMCVPLTGVPLALEPPEVFADEVDAAAPESLLGFETVFCATMRVSVSRRTGLSPTVVGGTVFNTKNELTSRIALFIEFAFACCIRPEPGFESKKLRSQVEYGITCVAKNRGRNTA